MYILSTQSILKIVKRERYLHPFYTQYSKHCCKRKTGHLIVNICQMFIIFNSLYCKILHLIFFPSQIIQNFCECEFPCFWSWMVTDDLRCFGGRVWGRAGFGVVVPVPWITPGWAEMVQSGFLQQGLAKSLTIRQTSGRLVYTGHLLYSKYQIWCL